MVNLELIMSVEACEKLYNEEKIATVCGDGKIKSFIKERENENVDVKN